MGGSRAGGAQWWRRAALVVVCGRRRWRRRRGRRPSNGGEGGSPSRRRRRRGWRRGSCSLMGSPCSGCSPRTPPNAAFMDDSTRSHAAEPRRGAAPIRRLPPGRAASSARPQAPPGDAVARYVYAHLIRPSATTSRTPSHAAVQHMASVSDAARALPPARPGRLPHAPGPRPQRREVPAYRRAEGELMTARAR